ncbi:MAG TPA: ATPase [Bacteroidales bacterium]|nr:ATPase [Bacteroidales bacterium]
MKTKLATLVVVLLIGANTVFAAEKTEKIVVKGNCSMCEKRIEKVVQEIDGVKKADWDKTTKKLKVTFEDTKTDADKIEIAIAKVGHDTPNHKTDNEVYNGLPDCCKYRENAKTH